MTRPRSPRVRRQAPARLPQPWRVGAIRALPDLCLGMDVTRVSKIADKDGYQGERGIMRVFQCADCGAEYAVIELAAPVGLRQKFCLHCGHSFPDPEGAAAFQYTLLKRPSEDTLEDL